MVLLKKILNRIAFNDEVLISYDEYDQHGYEAQKLLDLGILIREETNNARCGDCRSLSEMHKLPNGSYYIVCSSCEDGGMQVVDIEKCVVYRFNIPVLLNKMKQDLFGRQGDIQERIQNNMWSLDVHDIHGVQRSVYFLRRADDVRGGVFTHLRNRSSLDPVVIAPDNLATSLAESDFQIVYLESFLVGGEEGLFSSRLFLRQFSASVEAGASDAVYVDQNKIAIEDKCIRHNMDAHSGYKDEIAMKPIHTKVLKKIIELGGVRWHTRSEIAKYLGTTDHTVSTALTEIRKAQTSIGIVFFEEQGRKTKKFRANQSII